MSTPANTVRSSTGIARTRTQPMMIGSEIVALAVVVVWFATTFGLIVAITATAVVALVNDLSS